MPDRHRDKVNATSCLVVKTWHRRQGWISLWWLVVLAATLTGCSSSPATRTASFDGAELLISDGTNQNVFNQAALSRRLRSTVVSVDDPVYLKRKTYVGYWLSDVLELAQISLSASNVLVFSALDGYQATVAGLDLKASSFRPFLAIRDVDAPAAWERIQQGKEWVSPGPFYLTWRKERDLGPSPKLPWPYQIAEIRIANVDAAREKLFPQAPIPSDSVTRGFEAFQKNCIPCHSLNLEGGVLGPELNIPRNILEYRDRTLLREFISNPGNFRARSKMPAFADSLASQALDDLLDYLAWIGQHKAKIE